MVKIISYNDRADLAIAKTPNLAVDFALEHFIKTAANAILQRGSFHVALSGGSTPRALFERFTPEQLDWSKVHLYWSDERAVPPDNKESNYKMAMDAAFNRLPVPKEHIHRMIAEDDIIEHAEKYQQLLKKSLPNNQFDLVMLGMGDDGHTASLFPGTHALKDKREWVAANYIPQKNCWRMTLTYPCIHNARAIAIYVMGEEKAKMVGLVLDGPYKPIELPIQNAGTSSNKPLWVMDSAAAASLDINGNGNGRNGKDNHNKG